MKNVVITYGKNITMDGKKIYCRGYGTTETTIGKSLKSIRSKIAKLEAEQPEEITIEMINGEAVESLQKIGLITA